MTAAALVEVLSSPASNGRPLWLGRRRTLPVAFGCLVEQAEPQLAIVGGQLFGWGNHATLP